MTHKFDSGILTRFPRGKMNMKVADGKAKFDFGTMFFLAQADINKLPSREQRVYYTRGSFPAADWQRYLVGMVTAIDGDETDENGCLVVSVGLSIDLNNFADHLQWCIENEPLNTALLPFQYGDHTSGIPLANLRSQVANVTGVTGLNQFICSEV